MGIRGPKSTGLTILPAPKNKRKSPMPGMTKPACQIWSRIMGSYEPDHFKPQHYDQLRAFCESAALYVRAVDEYELKPVSFNPKTGVEKESPWVGISIKCLSAMAQLGTKLGITYNATTVSRGDTGQSSKPKSKREGLIFKG